MNEKKRKAKMGRPRKDTEVRAKIISVRATPLERGKILRDARAAGLSVSDLLLRPWRERKGR